MFRFGKKYHKQFFILLNIKIYLSRIRTRIRLDPVILCSPRSGSRFLKPDPDPKKWTGSQHCFQNLGLATERSKRILFLADMFKQTLDSPPKLLWTFKKSMCFWDVSRFIKITNFYADFCGWRVNPPGRKVVYLSTFLTCLIV